MYKEKEGKWSSEGKIKFPPLTSTIGVAIHYPLNYFVISDIDNNQLLFINQTTRDLICSFKPTLPPPSPSPSSSYFFQRPYGISVDEEAHLISDVHSISLFRSPIFL